jgi:hypothetical protein
MFEAPTNNEYGAKYYGTAAVSPVLFNPSDQGASWLGEGCGKCWKVTGTSNIQGYGYATTTLVLKGANLCPASNAAWCGNGAAHFDISAPGKFKVAMVRFASKALHVPYQMCFNMIANNTILRYQHRF